MSRYTLKPIKPEHQGYEVVIGWDGTLGNFFGEVRRPPDNDFDLGGEPVISIAPFRFSAPFGTAFNSVITAISEYAVIDRDLRARLWADSENEGICAWWPARCGSDIT
jgi:hypothetical protein